MEKKANEKPESTKISLGYAWYGLFVLFMVNLFNYVDRLSIGPAMEVIKRHFHVTDTAMGWLAGAFMAVYAIVSVPSGFLSDKWKRTRLIALGALVWSIFASLSGLCRTFIQFFTARALVGSGEGIYAPSGGPLVADYFPKRLRNTAISIFMSTMILGGALAYIVAGVILKKTERFNVPKVTSVVVDSGEKAVAGWQYKGVSETKDRLVRFDFTSPNGDKFHAILSRFDMKKPAAYKSKIFNVDFFLNDKPVDTKTEPEDVAALSGVLIDRISQREKRGLEKVSAKLEELPKDLKTPERYSKKLIYDKEKKTLTFIGVMSEKDYEDISKLTTQDKFLKAVGSIHSDTVYNYLRTDNWRWIFLLLGPPGLLIALLAFFLKEPLKGCSEEFLSEEEAIAIEKKGKTDYKVVLKMTAVILLIVGNILASYCVGALNTWLFPFVERFKGVPSADAAISFGPYVVGCAAIGVILSGILADKLQKKIVFGNIIVICVGLACSLPCLYIFLGGTTKIVLLSSLCAAIFFLSWINGPFNGLLISLIEPRLRAFIIGMEILLIHILGDAISPIIVGYLSDKHSLLYALKTLPAFLVAAIIVFIIAGIYVPRDLKAMEERMKKAATT